MANCTARQAVMGAGPKRMRVEMKKSGQTQYVFGGRIKKSC